MLLKSAVKFRGELLLTEDMITQHFSELKLAFLMTAHLKREKSLNWRATKKS